LEHYLRYGCFSIVAQVVASIVVWLLAIMFSSDTLFGLIVYFYWSATILVAKLLGASGESAMIAVPIYGMALGMLLYGTIIGLLVSYLKTNANLAAFTRLARRVIRPAVVRPGDVDRN